MPYRHFSLAKPVKIPEDFTPIFSQSSLPELINLHRKSRFILILFFKDSKPCLETRPHSELWTPLVGHCLGALGEVKPCLANRVWRHSPSKLFRHHLVDIVRINASHRYCLEGIFQFFSALLVHMIFMKKTSKQNCSYQQVLRPPNRHRVNGPVLLFLGFFFLIFSRKTSKLPRIFCPYRTHKILRKDRENTKLTKEIPRVEFTKEIKKTKEKKDWGGRQRRKQFLSRFWLKSDLTPLKACVFRGNKIPWQGLKGKIRLNPSDPICVRPHLVRSGKLQNESFPNFSIFRPEFCPEFPRMFRGLFALRFVGDGDLKKITKNPRHFSMQNSQANTKKIFREQAK